MRVYLVIAFVFVIAFCAHLRHQVARDNAWFGNLHAQHLAAVEEEKRALATTRPSTQPTDPKR